jgi:hypothetical protein
MGNKTAWGDALTGNLDKGWYIDKTIISLGLIYKKDSCVSELKLGVL